MERRCAMQNKLSEKISCISKTYSYIRNILHTERRHGSLNLRTYFVSSNIATALYPRVGALMRPLPFRCRITGKAEPFSLSHKLFNHFKSYEMKKIITRLLNRIRAISSANRRSICSKCLILSIDGKEVRYAKF